MQGPGFDTTQGIVFVFVSRDPSSNLSWTIAFRQLLTSCVMYGFTLIKITSLLFGSTNDNKCVNYFGNI
jgi:hypothetical protein